MTEYIATQYGPRHVRCNAVAPGALMTPALRDNLDIHMIEQIRSHNVLPFIGDPEDIPRDALPRLRRIPVRHRPGPHRRRRHEQPQLHRRGPPRDAPLAARTRGRLTPPAACGSPAPCGPAPRDPRRSGT
ncbi:SDR family oxidoreductase [Mobilicoccus pelagius]